MTKYKEIKAVQHELRQWGDFWARQKEGQGYDNKSNVQSVKEACEVGCASSSTLHLYSHMSDYIHVPRHIKITGERVDLLSEQCRSAIMQRYQYRGNVVLFKTKQSFLFWINKAEREML